ncbi:flagellar hook-associated protein FlgK [Betaproteobacteria bacterium]|nr:flagellar hook-associated protein FlgK [Betaproteobacteria bacterium]
MGLFSIGVQSLSNSQLGLATTAHNISNANTEDYSRQRIIQVNNSPLMTGSGYVGMGAYVSTIERIYSNFLTKQVNTAQTSLSELDVYASSLGELDRLLTDEHAGLESALEGFFAGVNQLIANPTSLATRQTMVSSAQSLVARFQSLKGQIDEQYNDVNGKIQSYVGSINSYAKQIATVNQQIINAESVNSQPPNDLYDQRDHLIAKLNEVVGIHTTTNENGSLNVFFGNGQQLVVGTTASSLTAVVSSEDPTRVVVGIVNASGTQELPESLISGGAISGLLKYRSVSLDAAANSLGQIAASMALTFNAQHALGQDLLGNIDGDANFVADFFKVWEPRVVGNANNPDATMVTANYVEPPPYSADGTFYTNLKASDYRLDWDGTMARLTRLSDNKQWTDASIAALSTQIEDEEGFSISDSGGFAGGSYSFLIQPARNAAQGFTVNPSIAADVRQVAAGAPILASVGQNNTGTASITSGSVLEGYTAPATGTPLILTYDSAVNGFTTFPSYPVTVSVNGVDTTYTAGTVPYINGATYTMEPGTTPGAGTRFVISGTPKDGDTFEITRNSNAVSDNRNALLLGQMQTGKTMAGNTASFSTMYAQMVSDVGNKGNEVNTVLLSQTTVLREARDARDALSGVNLDEEATNLLKYQQNYQAAAKMLQIASGLFDSILAIH